MTEQSSAASRRQEWSTDHYGPFRVDAFRFYVSSEAPEVSA